MNTVYVCQGCGCSYEPDASPEGYDALSFCSKACAVAFVRKWACGPHVTKEIPLGKPETCNLGADRLPETPLHLARDLFIHWKKVSEDLLAAQPAGWTYREEAVAKLCRQVEAYQKRFAAFLKEEKNNGDKDQGSVPGNLPGSPPA